MCTKQPKEEMNLNKMPHFLPFKSSKSVACNPDTYFKVAIGTDNQLSASVRGRPMKGVIEDVPKGFKMVLGEFQPAVAEGGLECKTIEAKEQFSQFAVWNLSLSVDETHEMKKALTWLQISKSVNFDLNKTELEVDEKHAVSDK